MKRVVLLAAFLAFTLTAGPALAQDGGEFCAIPEGCDLDGDGVAETPAGAPAPTEDQYGSDEEFCAIPEGCDASAPPDPPEESSASPDPSAASASPPADGASASAGSTQASSTAEESADGGSASGPTDVSAPSAGESRPVAGVTVLPETGGAPAALLGAGVLLIAGGLLVRGVLRS